MTRSTFSRLVRIPTTWRLGLAERLPSMRRLDTPLGSAI
jgi:hypothetical protein